MKHKLEELYLKLNERTPAFLLLGQDYLRFSTGKDPFLSEILRKYNQGAEPIHYGQLLEGEAKNEPEKALEWMQRLCERLSADKEPKTEIKRLIVQDILSAKKRYPLLPEDIINKFNIEAGSREVANLLDKGADFYKENRFLLREQLLEKIQQYVESTSMT